MDGYGLSVEGYDS
ncbi:hypothetical protein APK09_51 [Acinetobacter phage APK09]|uniref:Uncharacterized protein n=1 Tax=Acinetobacter phage APK09 TaxID=2873387 RepID=A0AAE8XK58_9CAUD|nr:hypothetical protein APK09_51 [Acinetobacter phage APK09]